MVYLFHLCHNLLQVEKQCAHFFGVTINEQQAESGIVVRVTSTAQSKFKVSLIHLCLYYKNFFVCPSIVILLLVSIILD